MGKWYFACGQVHRHEIGGGKVWDKDSVIVVEAANEQDAVAFVFNEFGRKWSGVYADFDNIEKYYKKGVVATFAV